MGRPRKDANVVQETTTEPIAFQVKMEPVITNDQVVTNLAKQNEAEKKIEAAIKSDEPVVSTKDANKALLNKFIAEETKMVKGRFRCLEMPGSSQRIQVRKYPGVPMFDMTMKDGEMYQVPLYVARFLNGIDATAKAIGGKIGTCSYPVHGFKWNPLEAMPNPAPGSEQGNPVPIVGISKRVRRYAFESAEFDV